MGIYKKRRCDCLCNTAPCYNSRLLDSNTTLLDRRVGGRSKLILMLGRFGGRATQVQKFPLRNSRNTRIRWQTYCNRANSSTVSFAGKKQGTSTVERGLIDVKPRRSLPLSRRKRRSRVPMCGERRGAGLLLVRLAFCSYQRQTGRL